MKLDPKCSKIFYSTKKFRNLFFEKEQILTIVIRKKYFGTDREFELKYYMYFSISVMTAKGTIYR